MLNKQEIASKLTTIDAEDVYVFQEIDSTNSFLLGIGQSKQQAMLCLSEYQTAGRGRRGNQWQAEAGSHILMSLRWTFKQWPEELTGLSLAVGMVVAEHLNQTFEQNVKVKWPNDLMVGGKKLGGILIELAGEASKSCHVVIGLGLNVKGVADLPSQAYQAVDLDSLGCEVGRNQLAASLANDLCEMLVGYQTSGFEPLLPAWESLSSYSGKKLKVGEGEHQVTGVMQGVDRLGALLLQDELGELHRFADSAVSVRLIE